MFKGLSHQIREVSFKIPWLGHVSFPVFSYWLAQCLYLVPQEYCLPTILTDALGGVGMEIHPYHWIVFSLALFALQLYLEQTRIQLSSSCATWNASTATLFMSQNK